MIQIIIMMQLIQIIIIIMLVIIVIIIKFMNISYPYGGTVNFQISLDMQLIQIIMIMLMIIMIIIKFMQISYPYGGTVKFQICLDMPRWIHVRTHIATTYIITEVVVRVQKRSRFFKCDEF